MENNRNHLLDIILLIDHLQKNSIYESDNTCTKPILGDNTTLFNTRPVSLYLCNNTPLELNLSSQDATSTIFRIEKVDGNCVTVRLLLDTDGTITSTLEFATINIDCIAAIRCFNDISLII